MWKIIASADKNWGIGKDNRLLVQIPGDMKRFREMTMGHIIVMGRKTLESFPGGMPLQGRMNVVLTKNPDYCVKNAVIMHDMGSLVDFLQKQEAEVFVIGGESIYRQLLKYCDMAYITRIDHTYSADAYLPELDREEEWEKVSESEEQTYFDLEYTYVVYRRKGRC